MTWLLFLIIVAGLVAWAYYPRLSEWRTYMNPDPFGEWVQFAADRRDVMLMDGRVACLLAVRKGPRSCKIRLGNRHYNCWVEDIALVKLNDGWVRPELWQAVDLDKRPGTEVRPHRAAPSARWLKVVPDHSKLHPSFQPKSD